MESTQKRNERKRKRRKKKSKSGEGNSVGNLLVPETTSDVPEQKEAASLPGQRHAFVVDETDHCETPLEAYQDISFILDYVAKTLGKKRESLIIYDPYFCDGRIKQHMTALGFNTVINKNKNFYEDIESKTVPEHDVLITNPPYSGIHMEKLLRYCRTSQKPFLLLLPHYVYTKDYYERDLTAEVAKKLFFLVPQKRYFYTPPAWVSSDTGSTALAKGKAATAPFPTFWYCRVASMSDAWLVKTLGPSGKYQQSSKIQYANCTAHIPRDFKGEFDESKKRPNPRARKRAKKRKLAP